MVDAISSRSQYGSPSKFKRPRVSAVRDYPRQCGMLAPTLNLRKGREEAANVHPYTCRPVLRKFPPPKNRKGVPVARDFPVKLNAPAALRNQISDSKGSNSAYGMPMISDSKGSNSAYGMSMADCKQLDVFNATNVHVCTDAKQSNFEVVRHSEPSKVPIATNDRYIHACIKSKEEGMSVVFKDCKLMDVSILTKVYICIDVKESNLSIDGSIANNVYACTDVRDCKPCNVPNATIVRDIHAFIKPKKEGMSMVFKDCKLMDVSILTKYYVCRDVKESHLSVAVRDEQCQVDVSIATNVYVCTGVEESSSLMVVGDEQCDSKPSNVPNAINGRDIHACIEPKIDGMSMDFKDCKLMDVSILNKDYVYTNVKESHLSIGVRDEQCQVDVSIATNVYSCTGVEEPRPLMVVGDEQRQAVVFSLDDYQVVLKDEEREKLASITKEVSLSMVVRDEQCSDALFELHDVQATFSDDEECVKAALVEVNNSQVGLSNDLVITNNELRVNRDKVKEVINLLREVYNELLQDKRGKQKGNLPFEAASVLLKQQKWINMDKRLGPISGVEVGDYFDWRAELNIIGLHRQHYHGIDYMELDRKKLATSVVDSGRYDNVFASNGEEEFPDTLIYSGEGENPKVQSKKSIDDQKLEGGNLALKNSAEAKTPIRVIRKVSFKSRKIAGRKYVYDGLYFVDSCRQEIASSGKLVFKFLLKRFPGQPKLDWTKLVRKDVCMNDISQGKERIPIRALNALDDEKPPIFNYVTNVTYPESYHPSMIDDGCDCSDGCSDSEDCPCIIKNGGSTYNYEECIMKAKPLIIECGPSCRCFTSCINRVSQRGIRLPLEVFKTKTKGWGVRSRSSIPCGSFICEYTGEIIRDKEGEQRIGNDEYLFDIGNNYGNHSLRDANTLGSSEGNECFTIDAARVGNVGRFINHSCSPNLYAQNVLFDHDNKGMPHIMLFAMENIPPMKELTYHYNYRIGGVCDANGNIKMKTCYCGSSECTGRMY